MKVATTSTCQTPLLSTCIVINTFQSFFQIARIVSRKLKAWNLISLEGYWIWFWFFGLILIDSIRLWDSDVGSTSGGYLFIDRKLINKRGFFVSLSIFLYNCNKWRLLFLVLVIGRHQSMIDVAWCWCPQPEKAIELLFLILVFTGSESDWYCSNTSSTCCYLNIVKTKITLRCAVDGRRLDSVVIFFFFKSKLEISDCSVHNSSHTCMHVHTSWWIWSMSHDVLIAGMRWTGYVFWITIVYSTTWVLVLW